MAAASVIGRGTVVRGHVRGPGSLEILGRVEGDVTVSGEVVLGEGAAVRGNVSGSKITVLGAVQGDLRGSDAVFVERGARVLGDLLAPRIGVGNGALVRGNVRTEGEPALGPARRPLSMGQTLRGPTSFGAKPVPKPEPAKAAPLHEPEEEPAAKGEASRQPPPPVVPALARGAKAKKKKKDHGA
jgi:cytoskeletal protein CcmA (bactofilin family)